MRKPDRLQVLGNNSKWASNKYN